MRTFARPALALALLLGCSGGGGSGPGLVDGGGSSSSGSSTSSGSTSTSSGATSSGAGGSICDWTSKCPAEKTPTEKERDTCRTEINGPCGMQYRTFGNCVIENETCLSSGETDGDKLGDRCANEVQAWTSCRNAQSSGSSGTSGSSGG